MTLTAKDIFTNLASRSPNDQSKYLRQILGESKQANFNDMKKTGYITGQLSKATGGILDGVAKMSPSGETD